MSIDDNDVPDELFDSDEPTQSAIVDSLASSNVSACAAGNCVTTTCHRLLVAPGNGVVSVAVVTVAIATAYVEANAPGVTSSDVCVNVTEVAPTVDQSG